MFTNVSKGDFKRGFLVNQLATLPNILQSIRDNIENKNLVKKRFLQKFVQVMKAKVVLEKQSWEV